MYVDMRTQTWPRSPGINVATHKSQPCCLSWCSCFAECGRKSTLMSGGAGVWAQGPVHCRWLYTCPKVQPRMLAAEQHGHPCTFWNVPLASAATWAHFWSRGPACFLLSFTAYPACIYIYPPENMVTSSGLTHILGPYCRMGVFNIRRIVTIMRRFYRNIVTISSG